MVDTVIPTTNNYDAANRDYDRDRLTAYQLLAGKYGIDLSGCITPKKLGDAVRHAFNIALDVYDTVSEDGDDFCLTCLEDELTTMLRQVEFLKDCVKFDTNLDDEDGTNKNATNRYYYLDPDVLVPQAINGGRDDYDEYCGVRDAYRAAIDEIIDGNLAVDWGWQIARLANEYDAVLDLIDAKLNNN